MSLLGLMRRSVLGRRAAGASYLGPGQQVWASTGGNSTFVVPAGVTAISAVTIAAGIVGYTNGISYTQGGYGGALEYNNAIPVTPGETLTISFTGGGAKVLRGGTTLCGANGQLRSGATGSTGFSGGNGYAGATPYTGDGGSAGNYSGPGNDGSGENSINGNGTSLLGNSPAGGTLYGAGGADGGTAGPGGIRIMWDMATPRAYPATRVGNL